MILPKIHSYFILYELQMNLYVVKVLILKYIIRLAHVFFQLLRTCSGAL